MRLSFWLCVAALACALTSPASSQQAADRVALVIGNSNYPDASTPLTSTSRDVRTVAAELRRLGFGVDLKENVTRQEMQRRSTPSWARSAAAPPRCSTSAATASRPRDHAPKSRVRWWLGQASFCPHGPFPRA